jgi:hypothetical protein
MIKDMKPEQVSLFISGLAFIVSAFSVIMAKKAINIEKNRDIIDLEKGKTALFNLTSRYFLLNLQRLDIIGTTFHVKNDSNFTSNYVDELELIASQFDNLMTTSYYAGLYKKYPMIGVMPVFIRKEIMFIKDNNSKGQQYGLDNVVWEKMFSTFEILQGEVKIENTRWSKILNDEIYQNAKKINDFLNSKK